jgi:adenylylsulfate kinase
VFYRREEKEERLGQHARVIWFTGLLSSGKTTLACSLAEELAKRGYFCQVLDGDILRSGINNDLGFSMNDRHENIRRAAEISRLLLNNGIIVLCSFISPTINIREKAREIIGSQDFTEVWLSTSLEVCEKRDTHGLYRKARMGEVKNLTGIDSVYEPPVNPDIIIDTSSGDISGDTELILEKLLPLISKQPV